METRGQCVCGAVTFKVNGEAKWQGYCHCRSCQRAHATTMLAAAMFDAADVSVDGETAAFAITDGERATQLHRWPTCGTRVFNAPAPTIRTIFPSLCEDAGWFEPQAHLSWRHRVVDVADDLPKFLDFPEAYGGSGKMA